MFKIKPRVSRKTAHGTPSDTHRGGLSRVRFTFAGNRVSLLLLAVVRACVSVFVFFSLLFAGSIGTAMCSTARVQWHSSHRFGRTFEPWPIARVIAVEIGDPRPDRARTMEPLKTWESRTLERLSVRKLKRKISRWYVHVYQAFPLEFCLCVFLFREYESLLKRVADLNK